MTDTLWDKKQAAEFLKKSPRWVIDAIRIPPDEPGSIPFVKVGKTPRFVPEVMREWTAAGCPPVATFMSWRDRQRRRGQRAG